MAYFKRTDYLMIAYMIISIIICFRRSMFFDLAISSYFLILLYKRIFKNNDKFILFFTGAIGLSIAFDIFWMVVYTKHWTKNETEDVFEESILRMTTLILSYIFIFFKPAVAYSVFLLKSH